jgi:hypothetical protein
MSLAESVNASDVHVQKQPVPKDRGVCVCVCKDTDQSDVSVVGANLDIQLHGFNERLYSAWIGGTYTQRYVPTVSFSLSLSLSLARSLAAGKRVLSKSVFVTQLVICFKF